MYTDPKDHMFVVEPITLRAGDEELPQSESTQLEKWKKVEGMKMYGLGKILHLLCKNHFEETCDNMKRSWFVQTYTFVIRCLPDNH